MSDYLETKIDELIDLSMRMKRHFMSEHLQSNPRAEFRKQMQEMKDKWKGSISGDGLERIQEFKKNLHEMKENFKTMHDAHREKHFGKFGGNFEGRTMLQSDTLRFVNKNSGCSMKDLADYLNISMSSATQLIERLLQEKLVTRDYDENDRRIARLNITEKGKEELEKCLFFIKEKIKKLYSNLDEKDINDFIRVMNKMLAGFETKMSAED